MKRNIKMKELRIMVRMERGAVMYSSHFLEVNAPR